MTVAALLNDRPIQVAAPTTPLRAVVALLSEHRIGAVPIVENDVVVGILSERDIVGLLAGDGEPMLDWPAERAMTSPVIGVAPETSILSCLSLMTQRRIRHLPVLQDQRMVGFVSIGDLVKARIERIEQEAAAMRAYISQ